MNQEDYKHILICREGRILRLTLNRPDRLNGVNHELHEELAKVFYAAAEDPGSDVVILTGAGQAFCAGGDLKWLSEDVQGEPVPFALESRLVRHIVYGIIDCPKPIIARVNGDAMGIGANIALLCDMIVAVDTARFADPHVRVGLVAGDGGALIWPQLLGFAKAKQYLLTGDAITAPEAERFGMINFSVPAAELDAVVDKYAQKLVNGAQIAIRYTKTTTNILLRQIFNNVFEAGVAYEGLSRQTNDCKEGLRAFIEKRKPKFTFS
jgi:enoyl-CoA hydratase